MLKQSIINSLPSYWYPGNGNYKGQFTISPNSKEFEKVADIFDEFTDNEYDIDIIKRVQHPDYYARFLLRKQQMSTFDSTAYTRRMLVVLPYDNLDAALKYNLDDRRPDLAIEFQEYLTDYIPDDSLVLIVNVLYENDNCLDSFHGPGFTSEHYIEYIVEIL